jgi:hypothetical protein
VTIPRVMSRASSAWYLALFVVSSTGVIWQMILFLQGTGVVTDAGASLPGHATLLIRFFSYFTTEANILVAVTSAFLVLDPNHDGPIWRVLRLEALFGITVTGVVYSTLLRGIVELHGVAAFTNTLVHYLSPALTVIGWLVFGPRPRITENTLLLSLIWPVLYIAWTFAHGAAAHWYPYPFTNVDKFGYVDVIRNGVILNLVLIGVGALYMWLDHRLPSTGPSRTAARIQPEDP